MLNISRKELLIVFFISLFFIVLATFPYIYAYYSAPAQEMFLGTRYNNHEDFSTYLSWIEQVKQGASISYDLYSTETQGGSFFNPLFWVVGKSAFVINAPSVLMYHVWKTGLGISFLLVGYIFITKFVTKVSDRYFIFILFGAGSGLGWLLGYPAPDLIQSEATNFLTLYESLINTATLLLILCIFTIFISYKSTHSFLKAVLWLGLLSNLVVLMHMYEIIALFVILFLYALHVAYFSRNYDLLRLALWTILLTFPAILWQVNILNQNAVLGVWATIQTQVSTQSWLSYLCTYGLLLILAFVGYCSQRLKKSSNNIAFLWIWLIVNIVLLINPFTGRFHQKLMISTFMPLILLAGLGIVWWKEQLVKNGFLKLARVSYIAWAVVLSLTNVRVLVDDFNIYTSHDPTVFRNEKDFEAIYWVRQNVNSDQVLLSSYNFGNLVPGFSARKVYVGHYDQTVDSNNKTQIALSMLVSYPVSKDPLPEFLKLNHIGYLVEDDEVKKSGGMVVSGRKYLNLVYTNEQINIYKVDTNLLN
jgi:hypothetical protein